MRKKSRKKPDPRLIPDMDAAVSGPKAASAAALKCWAARRKSIRVASGRSGSGKSRLSSAPSATAAGFRSGLPDVRPGTASSGTGDARIPEGRHRDGGKPAGPNAAIARTAVAPVLRHLLPPACAASPWPSSASNASAGTGRAMPNAMPRTAPPASGGPSRQRARRSPRGRSRRPSPQGRRPLSPGRPRPSPRTCFRRHCCWRSDSQAAGSSLERSFHAPFRSVFFGSGALCYTSLRQGQVSAGNGKTAARTADFRGIRRIRA